MDAESIYADGTYISKNPTWHEEDSPWKAKHIRRILDANEVHPSTVCEIGCGAGGILSALASDYGAGVEFSGFEISPQAFELCKAKERPNLRFVLGDALADDGTSFDVVMAIDVFEHVEDYFGFLRSLRSKGRYTVLHIPLDLSVQSVLRSSPLLKGRESAGHIHYFTKDTALAALADAGYTVVDHFYTPGAVELDNQSSKSRLLKLPRKLLFRIHQDLAVRILGGYSLMVLAR